MKGKHSMDANRLNKEQKYTSANTSQHQLARVYNLKTKELRGKKILDIGGGKYDDALDWAKANGSEVFIYDKYNRDEETNRIALAQDGYEVSILANVLNVIYEKEIRQDLVVLAMEKAPVLYITVFEKDGDGNGRPTKPDCWQESRTTSDYLEEVKSFVPDCEVTRKGKVIEVRRKEVA